MILDPQLFTAFGCALSTFLCATGSAIGSAHGATYAMKGRDYKAFVPIVVAGVLAIYGLIISYFLIKKMDASEMSQVDGFKNLVAGLSVGLACLASGWGMSIFLQHLNDGKCDENSISSPKDSIAHNITTPLISTNGGGLEAGVYGEASFRKTVLSMVFLEAIGLYGLIIALFLLH